MKHMIITVIVAISFTACTTKETKETNNTETIVKHDAAPVQNIPASPPAPEKQNRVELSISDTGSGIKVKIP